MMSTHNKTVWGGPVAASLVYVTAIILFAAVPGFAQAERRVSDGLRKRIASRSTEKFDVIVHGTADEIDALAARQQLKIKKRMSGGAVLEASGAQVGALADEVDHLSRDVEVSSFMAVTTAAIGADQVQAGLAGMSAFTAEGVGIAFVDSGIWAQHRSLSGRVIAAVDFTSNGARRSRKEDGYGHGTHVAAIAAGDAAPFRGVAPGANLISLRVLDDDGLGMASDVVEAIDWAVRNRRRYNIRVINL
jgi:serine protease AprX